jgi:hypothetical protein
VGHWENAVNWLDKALTAEQGDCSLLAVEQHAHFRGCLASQRWLHGQHLPKREREALRQNLIEQLEAAVLDLDMLCRRAATVERLNLLGGGYKRLAMLVTDDGQQLETLTNMAQRYQLSLARQPRAYAFTNWLAAELLSCQRQSRTLAQPDQVRRQIKQLAEALRQHLQAEPNFRDAASLADLSLSSLLLENSSAAKRRNKTSAGDIAAPVLAAYRDAIGHASSPRETASLRENLAFLKALWPPADSHTHSVLKHLLENLT